MIFHNILESTLNQGVPSTVSSLLSVFASYGKSSTTPTFLLTSPHFGITISFQVPRLVTDNFRKVYRGPSMTFQVGEKVVYPNHGVGTIENISTRSFGSQFERFYLLRLTYKSMTVMVPFSHVGDVGLRKVTKAGEIARVLLFLAAGKCKCSADWKNRFKENSEKMRVGGLLETAEVLKTLLIIQSDKPLSFREKKMLDRARHMLITEISICRGLSEADSIDLLQKALAKSSLTFPLPL